MNYSLKPVFNCSNNFALSCVNKVTNGTYNFVLLIPNVPAPLEIVITQVDDHININVISQLIKGISRVL